MPPLRGSVGNDETNGCPRVAPQDLVVQRILVRHGVSRDLGLLLVEDMKQALTYFKKHAVDTPLTAEEATGFHH